MLHSISGMEMIKSLALQLSEAVPELRSLVVEAFVIQCRAPEVRKKVAGFREVYTQKLKEKREEEKKLKELKDDLERMKGKPDGPLTRPKTSQEKEKKEKKEDDAAKKIDVQEKIVVQEKLIKDTFPASYESYLAEEIKASLSPEEQGIWKSHSMYNETSLIDNFKLFLKEPLDKIKVRCLTNL